VSEASAASGTSSKCVLVVEDEEAIRNNICDILEFGGYHVELASTGMQALAKVGTTHPDAIVLDLMMPVMDGWAFLQVCRTNPQCQCTPIMLMSASSRLEATALEYKVQGFVRKPFEMKDLLDTVERILQ
jgi:two-component system, chemotaxis family, chemotaxis protein CheY